MSTISIQEARATLEQVIHRLMPGEEIVITENDQPVAILVATSRAARAIPRIGTQRGSVLSMEHFDDPLDDFEEYQQ